MREPYVELGLAAVGTAIEDWKKESKACNWKTEANVKIKMIEDFLRSDAMDLCLHMVDLESSDLIERLHRQDTQKREAYERGEF